MAKSPITTGAATETQPLLFGQSVKLPYLTIECHGMIYKARDGIFVFALARKEVEKQLRELKTEKATAQILTHENEKLLSLRASIKPFQFEEVALKPSILYILTLREIKGKWCVTRISHDEHSNALEKLIQKYA